MRLPDRHWSSGRAAADIADQDAHALLRPLQDRLRQHVAGRARGLGLNMQEQPSGLLVDLRNRRRGSMADGINR